MSWSLTYANFLLTVQAAQDRDGQSCPVRWKCPSGCPCHGRNGLWPGLQLCKYLRNRLQWLRMDRVVRIGAGVQAVVLARTEVGYSCVNTNGTGCSGQGWTELSGQVQVSGRLSLPGQKWAVTRPRISSLVMFRLCRRATAAGSSLGATQ